MAKDKIVEYDSTANNNTVVGDVNLAENSMNPSDVNNAIREVMSHQKEAFGSGTPLYVDQANNRVGVNKTPTVALDVNGAVNVTGDITASSFNGGQLGGRRNIVINGLHKISQRGTANVTGLGDGDEGYPLTDRWRHTIGAGAGRYTASQEAITDLPGFATCLKIACTTPDTNIAASERFILEQRIEGQDLQQLKKGTSDAEKVTVSFYVKGHDSATYTVGLYDSDGRQIGATFSVTTSWARQTVTFPGDTSGTLADNNSAQLHLRFFLHGGSNYTSGTLATAWENATNANQISSSANSIFESDSATFFITGVQLEVGSVATPFEHRTFAEEMAMCQRYYVRAGGTNYANIFGTGGIANTTGSWFGFGTIPVPMRTAFTLQLSGGTPRIQNGQAGFNASSVAASLIASDSKPNIVISMGCNASGLTLYRWHNMDAGASAALFELDAEL